MRRIGSFLLMLMLVVSAGICLGRTPDGQDLFFIANDHYEKGEYDKAIELYNRIVDSGNVSAALYYNLAGAYFRSGDLGRSVLNYRRALNLAPRDPDIKANYRFVRSMITGRSLPEKGFWSWKPLRAYARDFTVNEIALFASLSFFFMFGIGVLAMIFPRAKKYLIALILTAAVFTALSAAAIWRKVSIMGSYAVTVVPQADALFGPVETATKFFTLYEGVGVMIKDERDGWYRVRRSDGKRGWVRKDLLEKI